MHTPGPWTVAGIPDRYGFQSIVIDGPKCVAYAFCIQHDPATGDPLNRGLDEQQANARLIAAAPAMLVALEGLTSLLRRSYTAFGQRYSLNVGETNVALSKGHSAIAEAKGE